MTTVSATELHIYFELSPDEGTLFWKPREYDLFPDARSAKTWNTRFAGKEALTALCTHGYRHGYLLGSKIKAHRVVYAMANGEWPEHQIDHIDGNRANNAVANLRAVTAAENGKNKKIQKNNSSGSCGVSFISAANRWRARIGRQYIGVYPTKQEALVARQMAEQSNGYHPNHGRH